MADFDETESYQHMMGRNTDYTQVAGDVVPMPMSSAQGNKAWAGQILNQTRKGSDRTNVVPIKS